MDDEPVSYFNAYDDELDDDELDDIVTPVATPATSGKPAAAPKPAVQRKPAAVAPKKQANPSLPAAKPQSRQTKSAEAKIAPGDRYVVPVEINGADSDWLIPTT